MEFSSSLNGPWKPIISPGAEADNRLRFGNFADETNGVLIFVKKGTRFFKITSKEHTQSGYTSTLFEVSEIGPHGHLSWETMDEIDEIDSFLECV